MSVNKISYRVPLRSHVRANHTHAYQLFELQTTRTNMGKQSPLYRLADIYNKYFTRNHIDLFFLILIF